VAGGRGMLQGITLQFLKDLLVLGVGDGVAGFEEIDAEAVQAPGDVKFVLEAEVDALALHAVT
jgi:hypothetical protein